MEINTTSYNRVSPASLPMALYPNPARGLTSDTLETLYAIAGIKNERSNIVKAKVIYVFAIITMSFIMFSTGCATAPAKKTFIDQAIWPETTKGKVYTACITALQMEGFDIHPLGTSLESGLIVTGQEKFYPLGTREVIGFYKLQILVSETKENKIMFNVNVKCSWTDLGENVGYLGLGEDVVENEINNRVAEDLGSFFPG